MNLLVLEEGDLVTDDLARLGAETDRRRKHVLEILGASVGDELRVGRLNGAIGQGRIEKLDHSTLEIRIHWNAQSPPASSIRLALALPRPPTLRKVLQSATAMGVKSFVLFHCRRVEKSYWQSPLLQKEMLHEQMLLGLEQARDTILPTIHFERRFRPWVEDRLSLENAVSDESSQLSSTVVVADPEGKALSSMSLGCIHRSTDISPSFSTRCTLVIGPEGGFIPHERELFRSKGIGLWSMGPRILRVEHATVAALAKLEESLRCSMPTK